MIVVVGLVILTAAVVVWWPTAASSRGLWRLSDRPVTWARSGR
jgi:hypothetical protein